MTTQILRRLEQLEKQMGTDNNEPDLTITIQFVRPGDDRPVNEFTVRIPLGGGAVPQRNGGSE
jgi:hypothetical protein